MLVALFKQGRYAEIEVLAREMTERFPQHGFGWKAMGTTLLQQGRNAEALAALQKAAALSQGDAQLHNNLGNTLVKLGRLPEAEASYRQALKLNPGFIEAHHNLGNTLLKLGRLPEAEAIHRRTLELRPDFAEAHNNLGYILLKLNRLSEAEASYRRALELKPDYAEAHCNLGDALHRQGRFSEAEASYRQALKLKLTYSEAHNNLADTLLKLGRLPEAEASCRLALKIKPDCAEAHNNLGNILNELGRLGDAEASYRRALELDPGLVEAHSSLGVTLREMGRLGEAEAAYRRALQIKPDYAEAHSNLGNTLLDQGRLPEAETSYRRALEINPDYADAHTNLGVILGSQGRIFEAEACHRRALELKPDFAGAHNNLGNTLTAQGRLPEAEACYRRALEVKPDSTQAHSNLLFACNYQPNQPPERKLAEARRYGELVAQQARPYKTWSNVPDTARCLRVGLVSGDMHQHPVGNFLESVLAALTEYASGRLEFFAYSNQPCADAVTEQIKACCRGWHSAVGLSDETLARQIREDGIDILFDLSGHTAHNRLPVFAWKPAPVQVTWLGYLATTGVAAMDYLIADPWTLPETEAIHFTEKIWRLPETYLCFTPPDADVQVAPLPALANGYITFGCFNNLTKVNDAVVALWARVLVSVPNSRLFLKTKQLNEAAVRQSVAEQFAVYGIGVERLILKGLVPRAEYLAPYHRVDIALDPFPYPGITTSVEGLWMGVPLLTLAGDSFLSRQGIGLLMNAGLPEWIAADADDYVARAVSHAGDLQGLAALRNGLRQQVLASPIFDAPRFVRHFEAALRGMWAQWCDQQQGKSL